MPPSSGNADSLYQTLHDAIVEGDSDRAAALTTEALGAGLDPLEILERGLTTSLRRVGACWETGELYLPEMMLAAEAVKAGLAVLKPRLGSGRGATGNGLTGSEATGSEATGSEAGRDGASPPVCVIGTVAGDIHDIGKNIIVTLLEASGFMVVDLGTDIEVERFVSAVREQRASLLGLSALLTSTMPAMRDVIAALEEEGLRRKVKIAVGGAPVTAAFARDIGADGTASDGMEALRLFQSFVAKK